MVIWFLKPGAIGNRDRGLSFRVKAVLLAGDQREFRRRVRARESGFESADYGQPVSIARLQQIRIRLQIRLERIRDPGVGATNTARERHRCDAYDCHWLIVEMNDLPYDLGVCSKTIPPQLFAQNNNWAWPGVVCGLQ